MPHNAVGAGEPAKNIARWMARASPVFAGKPAPTGMDCPKKLDTNPTLGSSPGIAPAFRN
ncbi:hypothetical protein F7661_24560 [Pseudomonas sp. CFA]|nr:hypothetical protein F7661_24560 [Pseudomonas sp. CFA]